jgi:protein arginine N-methyltransferase 1
MAYRDAILNNAEIFRGKVRLLAEQCVCISVHMRQTVLDVGCGTGILCLFAARAGASKVIGVDFADVVNSAQTLPAIKEFSDVITLVHGRLEDNPPPIGTLGKSVDIIISEWMGYALLYESMCSSVIYARDTFLVDGGRVLPNVARLFVVCALHRSSRSLTLTVGVRRSSFWSGSRSMVE